MVTVETCSLLLDGEEVEKLIVDRRSGRLKEGRRWDDDFVGDGGVSFFWEHVSSFTGTTNSIWVRMD